MDVDIELAVIRDLRGRNAFREVLQKCLTLTNQGYPYPHETTDVRWLEVAVHNAWARAELHMPDAALELLDYVIDNTPDGALTRPYVMAVCDRAVLRYQRGEHNRAVRELQQLRRAIAGSPRSEYTLLYRKAMVAMSSATPTPPDDAA